MDTQKSPVLSRLFNLGSKVWFVDLAERWGWRFCKKIPQRSPGWLHWVHQTKKTRSWKDNSQKTGESVSSFLSRIHCDPSCFHVLSTFHCHQLLFDQQIFQVVLYFASHTIVSKLQARHGSAGGSEATFHLFSIETHWNTCKFIAHSKPPSLSTGISQDFPGRAATARSDGMPPTTVGELSRRRPTR